MKNKQTRKKGSEKKARVETLSIPNWLNKKQIRN